MYKNNKKNADFCKINAFFACIFEKYSDINKKIGVVVMPRFQQKH